MDSLIGLFGLLIIVTLSSSCAESNSIDSSLSADDQSITPAEDIQEVVPTQEAVPTEPWLIGYCPAKPNLTWTEIISRSKELMRIEGEESGVVVDEGYRILKEFRESDCDGNGTAVTFRFTIDHSPTLDGAELFIKNEATNQVAGFAINSEGLELYTVPKDLAFDKHDNKKYQEGVLIETRRGCAECHSSVSIDYSIIGAESFWDSIQYEYDWQLELGENVPSTPQQIANDLP